MKRLLLIVLLGVLHTFGFGQTIEFDSKTCDFGTIEEDGGTVTHTFRYTNKGSKPFVITDAASSCGCTTPEYSPEPTLRGKSGEVTVTFDPEGRPGRNSKQVILKTTEGTIILRVLAVVNPRERTLEERFPFSIGGNARIDRFAATALRVPIGGELIVGIEVANGSTLTPISVGADNSSMPEGVKLISKDGVILPRESKVLEFSISGDSYGEFLHTLYLTVGGTKRDEKISIAGVVVDNFSSLSDDQLMRMPKAKLDKQYFRLESLEVGGSEEFEFTVSNQGHTDLLIRAVESSSTIEVEATEDSIPAGESMTLRAKYNATQGGYDSAWVRLILNDPRLPVLEVKVVVEVQ